MGNSLIHPILFQPPTQTKKLPNGVKVKWIKTRLGTKIPSVYISAHNMKGYGRGVILYSHGNSEDLGRIYSSLVDLSIELKVDIMAYDYTGYGLSQCYHLLTSDRNGCCEPGMMDTPSGNANSRSYSCMDSPVQPSEEKCYADIDAAYDYLRLWKNVPASDIIIYGRSLGSGPSCYLAKKKAKDELGGLILHSAFTSVFKVGMNVGCSLPGDMFDNLERIKDVKCPTLIIHGTYDEVIPFDHAKELFEAIPNEFRIKPLFAERMYHNNISYDMRKTYLITLNNFLKVLAKNSTARKQGGIQSQRLFSNKMRKIRKNRRRVHFDENDLCAV